MEVKSNASYTDATNKENNLGFGENTKLIERVDIENTPFKRVITDEGEFLTIGAKAITGRLTTEEADEKVKEIGKQDWKLILSILSVLVQETTAQLHLDVIKWNQQMEELNTKGGNNE